MRIECFSPKSQFPRKHSFFLQKRFLIKMHEDYPASAPLLSYYDNSKSEEGDKRHDLTIDNDGGSSRFSVISEVVEEIKSLYIIAFPMIITGLVIYGKSAISIHFPGKLGKEALAGGCLAIGMANITGYSIISGLAAGMEGISSQAYGAQKWVLVGQTLQRTIIILILTYIPISILWLNFEPILLICGQNPTITSTATTYLAFSPPGLLLKSFINPLKIYLRTENVTFPLMFSAALALVLHGFTNYVIFHCFSLGIKGVALASAFTDLNFLITLLLCLWFAGACSKSWQGWSCQCFKQWKPILHQAIPSCVSVCLEWWWYELLILFSGLLDKAADTAATTGIIIQATSLIYNFPLALSLAISTKVGNELGVNRPNNAKTASFIALLCSLFTGILAMIFMITTRNAWGRIFIVGLCEIGNCPQTTICGLLKGSARPVSAAHINLISFCGVGLPLAILMGFGFNLGLLGLLLGLLAAQMVCAIMMMIVLARTYWKVQVNRARELTGIMNVSNIENNDDIEGLVTYCVAKSRLGNAKSIRYFSLLPYSNAICVFVNLDYASI